MVSKSDKKNSRSSLEQKMYEILTSLNIDFVEQFPDRTGFVIDFAILNGDRSVKIAIETDGSIYHQNKKRDRFRDYKLHQQGWKVIRFVDDFTKEDVEIKLESLRIIQSFPE